MSKAHAATHPHDPANPELEQELVIDLQHSLKLMPASQRELFASEVATYILKREAKAYERGGYDTLAEIRSRAWVQKQPLNEVLDSVFSELEKGKPE